MFRTATCDPPLPRARWRSASTTSAHTSPPSTTGTPSASGRRPPDAKDLEKRIRALPGFGDMKVLALSAVLAKRFGVEVAKPLAPSFPTLGDVDSVEALHEYQAAKRAHEAPVEQKLPRRESPPRAAAARRRAPSPAPPESARYAANAIPLKLIAAISGGYEGSGSARPVRGRLDGARRTGRHTGVLSESLAPAGSRAIGRSRRRG